MPNDDQGELARYRNAVVILKLRLLRERNLPFFEIALALMRLDHVACRIVNADRSDMRQHPTHYLGL